MKKIKNIIAGMLPRGAYRTILLPYHAAWAFGASVYHGTPAKGLTIIGVTGTKGKSTVTEMLFAILSAAGKKTAVAGTIRFAHGEDSRPNLFKMTVPGRGFLQKFLHHALQKGCTHAVLELTSEAALQYRHTFLSLDALVFTNLQKEHIESHGSMEKYAAAKMRLGKALARSAKRPRSIIANADDSYGKDFLALSVENKVPFSFADASEPEISEHGVSFTYKGVRFSVPQPGLHNLMNALAAIKAAEALGIPLENAKEGLAGLTLIPGRAERIAAPHDIIAVVDYAHTPDSLQALYDAFPSRRKIGVLGNTGGGRDTWKRPEMAKIAENMCAEVILTDEDPYDESPAKILEEMAAGMTRAPRIILDRREAIRTALSLAEAGDAVIISGKGTDPYIMRANGVKEPWSDAQVVREEVSRMKELVS